MKMILMSLLLIHLGLSVNKACDSLNLSSTMIKSNESCQKESKCKVTVIKNCLQFSYLSISNTIEEILTLLSENESKYFFSIIEFDSDLRLRPPILSFLYS